MPPPAFGHVPLLIGEDGHRLAKRGGALTVQALRARGVRPQAIVGFLARTAGLGDGGPVNPDELVAGFKLEALSRAPSQLTERDLDGLLR
jgi:glutamyl-tRNA synthetase